MYIPHSDCHSPIVNPKKMKTFLHYLCVAAISRPQLVISLVLKTSPGTSDEVSHGDCRHVCDDEESRHEDLDEGDHFNNH